MAPAIVHKVKKDLVLFIKVVEFNDYNWHYKEDFKNRTKIKKNPTVSRKIK